ncbi:hypothetical protein SAMN05421821_103211 [Mucilaginibacter lappiensis]|nr:hypothetical protein SAMN05421821_103211 [Mucilaginibacter lappiensis]
MYKTGGQLLGINGSIFKFNTSNASIVKPLNPQPISGSRDMCIDALNNRLFVCVGAEVWVYDITTLTRTNVIDGFQSAYFIKVDPNPVNNRIVVYNFGDDSVFKFIDRTTLTLNNNDSVFISGYLGGGFEFDQALERNQVLATTNQNTIAIFDATNFSLKQQIIDPLFTTLGKVRRNANRPDEIFIFTNGYPDVIVVDMATLTYSFKTISAGAFDATADPNLPNNRIYTANFGASSIYTATDFGYIQNLNLPPATLVVADPVISNHRLFFGGVSLLYAVTLG